MPGKLYDKFGNEVTHRDLQDKENWCEIGQVLENSFVSKYGSALSLKINPEKLTIKYAPDLIDTVTNELGDLKTINTPFFTSQIKFGLDPQHTVTFDVKDYNRYSELYPNLHLYFWINWKSLKYEGINIIEVKTMEGVWKINFQDLKPLCVVRHIYPHRVNDTKGNAKEVYVFNVNRQPFIKVL